MAKAINFETLPREIRTALYAIADPETFTVERLTPDAITVINKRMGRVYKFVRKNKRMVAALDREIENLILLRNKKIPAPTPVNRAPLKAFDSVSLIYVDGDLVAGNATPKHLSLLADTQLKLHAAFEKDVRNKSADLSSTKNLRQIFAKANSGYYNAELVRYARSIQRQLKNYELSRADLTFVHSDANLSNVVFDGHRAVLIDWANAGWASKYFDIAGTVHALLSEKKALQKDLLNAYLAGYFQDGFSERDIELIDLHVKLRFLQQATWHLNESKDDQLLHRPRILKTIDECARKAQRFSLAAAIK